MHTIIQSFTIQEQKVLDIFKRHVAAFTSGNLEAVLSDFDEGSVVITPDGVFDGLDRIRTLYNGLLAEFGVIDRGDSPGLAIDVLHVRHDTIFISWHAESMQHVFPFGTDTFICHGGRFARQSIAFSPPQRKPG